MVRCSICGTNGHNARTCKHKGQSASQAGPSSDTHVDVQDVVKDAMEEPRVQKKRRVGDGSSTSGHDPTDGLQKCPICFGGPDAGSNTVHRAITRAPPAIPRSNSARNSAPLLNSLLPECLGKIQNNSTSNSYEEFRPLFLPPVCYSRTRSCESGDS